VKNERLMSRSRSDIERARADSGPFWQRRAVYVAFGVVVIYTVVACLLFWPTGPLNSTRLPDGVLGDPDEMTWFLAWTPWALTHGHNLLVSNAIDLPGGVNLANNTSVPLLGLLATPFTLALGPIAAFNLLLRVALAASAGVSYFVFRRWCHGTTGPFLGGLIFGFSPALLSHLHTYGHLDLIFVPFLPVTVALIDELVVRQRWSAVRTGALLGLAAVAQYLVSAELFADAVLLGVIAVLWLAARHHELVRTHWRHVAIGLGVALGCFLVVGGYPIYLALLGPNHLTGPVQAVAHLQRFRSDLAEIAVPDPRQLLSPARLSRLSKQTLKPVTSAGGSAELGGYLGVPLLITTAALVVGFRRTRVVGIATLLAVCSFIASLGSRLQVAGHVTGIPLPEVLLAKLPLFDNAVPARFSIFVALFVAMAFAIALDRFIHTEHANTPTQLIASGLVIVGVGASLVTLIPHIPVSNETTALPTNVAQALHDLIAQGAVVLTYPYPESPYAQAMVWQASDDFRFTLLGGYANIRTPSGEDQIFPVLSQPAYVQEFLGAAESGNRGHYPHPGVAANPDAELCSFIEKNHVTTVVYQAFGPGSAAVESLFMSALSKPTSQAAGLSVWSQSATRGCDSTAKQPAS
jgi:hypothetical protein